MDRSEAFADVVGTSRLDADGMHEYEGKTRVVSLSQYRSAEALKTVVDMGMERGITETWDRLAQHLQAVQ